METTPTLETAQALIRQAGYRNFPEADWEDEHSIFAFSYESAGRGTFGAPKCSVSYSKDRGCWSLPRELR